MELPVPYGLDRVLIQTVTQRTLDSDIRGKTFRCDDQAEHDYSGNLRGSRLVRISRIRTYDALRKSNAADTYDVSAVYKHRAVSGFLHGLALG